MSETFSFRPPPRSRTLRLALGIPLSLVMVGIAVWVIAVLWLPRIIRYEITSGTLTVQAGWTFWPVVHSVAMADIESARRVELSAGKKVAGTQMPGYCTGRFRFDDLGSVWLAGDCSARGVALSLHDDPRPWVLTPADPEAFLAALGGEALYSSELRPPPASTSWNLLRTGLVVPLLLTLVIPAVFLIAPGRLCYRVVPGHLEVDTVTGTRRFSLGTCLVRTYRPESTGKLIGSSLPGYHTGRFSVDGMTTRVYATHLGEGILVEGPDLRLFITPEEPQAALEVLRTRGGAA